MIIKDHSSDSQQPAGNDVTSNTTETQTGKTPSTKHPGKKPSVIDRSETIEDQSGGMLLLFIYYV